MVHGRREPFEKDCRYCGKTFKTTNRVKVYCTNQCHVDFENARRPTTQMVERFCVVCEKPFMPQQQRGPGRRWCSEECHQTLLRGYKRRKQNDPVLQTAIKARRTPSKLRAWQLNSLYGLSVEQYSTMLLTQEGKCAICRKPETAVDPRTRRVRMLGVDHCHRTSKIRALLCMRCNQGLGSFQDDPALLQAAAKYLQGDVEMSFPNEQRKGKRPPVPAIPKP